MNGALGAWTPGPWKVEEGETYAGPPLVIAQSGTVVGGFMGMGTKNVAEDNANAHLCAAAPDLYDVLDDLMGLLIELQMGHDVSAIVDGNLREVLKVRAKARGEG